MSFSLSQYYDKVQTERASRERFSACVHVVLTHEGGFVNHPDDPGGATNMGITRKTLAAWRGRPTSVDEVRMLGRFEAQDIYHQQYWMPVLGDQLPRGLDLAVFDMAVNAGPARAVRILQDLLDVSIDGHMGLITMDAVKRRNADEMIAQYSDARLRFYQGLPGWPVFGKGWSRRVADTRISALAMRRNDVSAAVHTSDAELRSQIRASAYQPDPAAKTIPPFSALWAFLRRLLS